MSRFACEYGSKTEEADAKLSCHIYYALRDNLLTSWATLQLLRDIKDNGFIGKVASLPSHERRSARIIDCL